MNGNLLDSLKKNLNFLPQSMNQIQQGMVNRSVVQQGTTKFWKNLPGVHIKDQLINMDSSYRSK